jgi:ribosomal protein L29
MKSKDLTKKDAKSLKQMLLEQKKKLNDLILSARFGKIKNYNEISNTKKTIARVLTILNKK